MRHWPARFSPLYLLGLLILLCAAPLSAEVDAKSAQDSEPGVSDFASLQASHLEKLRRISLLKADAATAIGDDQVALRGQILQWTLEEADTLGKMRDRIEEMETAGENASEEREALASLLPALQDSLRMHFATETEARDRLKTEEASLEDVDAIADIQSVIRRKDDVLLRILSVGIDTIELSDFVGAPSGPMRESLDGLIQSRARLAMSHVNLARQRVDDIGLRMASASDPTALQPTEAAANANFEAALLYLGNVADLMERLEIDATDYRQFLVATTGELTVDAIDSEVVGELANRWTADLREGLAANGASYAFQFLIFALIGGFFWGLSRFVRRVVSRAVEAPHLRFSQLLKRMLISLSTSAVLVFGVLVALSQLGIEVAPMLAGLGIVGFVLGFALQDTLANFAAGVMILIYRPFDVGDMIDCAGGVYGEVSHMSLVSTTILTIDNKTLIVPNNKIWGDVITNVTAQAIRRIDLEFGIGYGDDIPHAEEVLWSIIKDHPKVLADPEPVVKVHSLGDSSVNFVVRPWVARDDYWDVHWDFMREVKLRFDREGVSIPFPQRDVHFYSDSNSNSESESESNFDAPKNAG